MVFDTINYKVKIEYNLLDAYCPRFRATGITLEPLDSVITGVTTGVATSSSRSLNSNHEDTRLSLNLAIIHRLVSSFCLVQCMHSFSKQKRSSTNPKFPRLVRR